MSLAAVVIYLIALGFALGGDSPAAHGGWTWGRSSLITVIVVGLVLTAYGYGVHAADKRAERAIVATVAAVEASREDMHADHAALHRENVKMREMLGPLVEAAGRLQAFEERRTHEIAALRQEVADMHELLAVMRQESPPAQVIVQRVGELDDRLFQAEKVLGEVAPKVNVAYTVGFTDGVGGTLEE